MRYKILTICLLVLIPVTSQSQDLERPPRVATTTVVNLSSSEGINILIEAEASIYGQNANLAKRIIHCESLTVGSATGTRAWIGEDIGFWQINSYYHKIPAKKLGLDIYKQIDNLVYGFILLKNEGTAPWKASKSCWNVPDST